MPNKTSLNFAFDEAIASNAKYIFIGINADGVEEVIAIPSRSFDKKREFYNNAYSDVLVHVMNKNVFIFGFAYGDATVLSQLI